MSLYEYFMFHDDYELQHSQAWAAVSLMLHSISNFSTIFNLARVPTLQEMPHLNTLQGMY